MVNTYLSKEDLCSITLESFIDESGKTATRVPRPPFWE